MVQNTSQIEEISPDSTVPLRCKIPLCEDELGALCFKPGRGQSGPQCGLGEAASPARRLGAFGKK